MKIVEINQISKKYQIYHEGQLSNSTLVETLALQSKKLLKQLRHPFTYQDHDSNYEEFWALKDVSFDIQEGDRLGIIGRNGAGKSTLLKILSRITEPSKGQIKVKGRVSSLLEVGTGFHPELTGRENIYLNGAILGMRRNEIKKKFDEIVAFSELEKFLDTPVKRYSSGMYARLGFAIASSLDSDLMIIDEVLAVGDTQFQEKCFKKINELGDKGRTVIFVSHDLGSVLTLCNKGVYLEKGKLVEFGNIDTCVNHYMKNYLNNSFCWEGDIGDEHIRIYKANLEANQEFFYQGEVPRLTVEYEITQPDNNLFFTLAVMNGRHQVIARAHTFDNVNNHDKFSSKGRGQLSFDLDSNLFHEGDYLIKLSCFIHNKKRISEDEIVLKFPVYIKEKNSRFGYGITHEGVFLGDKWKWSEQEALAERL